MNTQKAIESGQTVLGVEFGSTRIKAVLLSEDHTPIASGSYEWENRYENGIWTYHLEDVWTGLQDSYRNLSNEVFEKYNIRIRSIGAIGFSAHTPLRIDLMPFEVTATDDASGNVAIIGSHAAGVRAVNGKITVRNLKTSESFVLLKGQERLLGIQGGVNAPALAQVASSAPTPIPSPAPQTPAGKTNSGLAMDTGSWLAVAGIGALGGIAIWALVDAHNNQNDIDALKARLASPSKP